MNTAPFADKTIAVLAGGQSSEREVSLRSGAGVQAALEGLGLKTAMVDPQPRHLAEQLEEVGADIVYNALHGGIGEDGRLQALLELIEMPYTGCGVLSSALSLNKLVTKRLLQALGMSVPLLQHLQGSYQSDMVAQVIRTIGLPAVTKPISDGSSVGITICRDETTLARELEMLLHTYGELLVDAYIEGTELTVGVLGCGAETRALPVLEIIPHGEFYDYDAKYTKGLTDLICPARISAEATRRAQDLAVAAHQALLCHGISRCDMHLDRAGHLWIHEVNSCPGMTETSDIPHAAAAAGLAYDQVVLEVLHSALIARP